MGYYTQFKLETSDESEMHTCETCGHESFVDHGKNIAELTGYHYLFDDSIKWYDHEKHMLEYSKRYPTVLFTLSGEGEEAVDIWIKYFQNGKSQIEQAKIQVGSFDPSKLA